MAYKQNFIYGPSCINSPVTEYVSNQVVRGTVLSAVTILVLGTPITVTTKFGTVCVFNAVVHLKDEDGLINGIDSDKTAPSFTIRIRKAKTVEF